MKKFFVFLILCIFLSASVLASASELGDWWGTVTIDGTTGNNGARVDAYIGSVKVASTTVGQFVSGYYLMHIEENVNNTILFKVNGIDATTVSWSKGDHQLNLAITTPTTPAPSGGSGGGGGGGGGLASIATGVNENQTENTGAQSSGGNGEESTATPQASSTNFLTGAVTGLTNFAKSGGGIVTIVSLVTVAIAGIAVYASRKKNKVFNQPESSEEAKTEENQNP